MSILIKHPVTLILSWNGKDAPFEYLVFDEAPRFEIVLFNYSGNQSIPAISDSYHFDALISEKTEFKGSILHTIYQHYNQHSSIDYIGFMDDDIEMSVSSINKLLDTAYLYGLDAFQAAVHPDSYHSFQYNKLKPGMEIQFVNWVEIMTPFYRKQLFDAAHEFYQTNISSYGIDNFAIPYFQELLGMTKTAVIHSVSMKHLRKVTDGSKKFSNGLTARQEGELVRKKIIQKIKNNPALQVSPQFKKEILELNQFRWSVWKNLCKDFFLK